VRLFIALELPARVRAAATAVARRLRQSGADVKWVAEENLHVTLKFLGEVDPSRQGELTRALEAACAGVAPLELQLGPVGAFPKPSRPQVIWLGLAGETQRLARLSGRVQEALRPLGFEPERRAFAAHLTLGRLRRRKGRRPPPAGLARELAGCPAPEEPAFWADQVVLMRSTLKPTGAVYRPVHQVTLSPAES